MLRRVFERIRSLFRKPDPPIGKVAYQGVSCRQCGGRSAVLDGLCWHCRTGNAPVTEPMVWGGPDAGGD